MTPTRLMNDIELKIDTLLESRAILFEGLQRQSRRTQGYNKVNGKILKNTRAIKNLRLQWREIDETYNRRH